MNTKKVNKQNIKKSTYNNFLSLTGLILGNCQENF